MKIGILTSGGDCAGLNAVMRGFVKAIVAAAPKVEICGIKDGYGGLLNRSCSVVEPEAFFNILNLGGTILGTSRQPYKKLVLTDNDSAGRMRENYNKMGLDALVVLGGQGTHKTAAFLSGEGLNIIGLPKTIDNDIFGTDVTFGFHTAAHIATECLDRVQTTAASHGRVMVVEIMGNKAGWLTLFAGVAGGADVILIPEIPFAMDKVAKAAEAAEREKGYCIIAAAEGAMDEFEATLAKKERCQKRAEAGEPTASNRIARAVAERLDIEARVVVLGHIQRGGSPVPYDRVLCTQMGAHAARLAAEGRFGVTVALDGARMTCNALADIAGKTKFVPPRHELVRAARDIGVSFGD